MSGAILVLNATYEPVSRTTLSRAISLVLEGKAVIEEADPLRRLRHMAGEMMWPKVVRLVRYVKVPFRYGSQIWTKQGVLRRDNHTCGYCNGHATTIDHIVPRAQGGRDQWLNTVAACERCNFKKRDRTPKEARMPLLIEPYEPKRMGFLYAS